jgi:hypothetical protein
MKTYPSALSLLLTALPSSEGVSERVSEGVSYKPFQRYEGDNFFDAFDFYTGDDPTHGE